jgi:hypothetical protein
MADAVDLDLYILYIEVPGRGYLVSPDNNVKDAVWVSNSECTVQGRNQQLGLNIITMPRQTAITYGLIKA